MSRSKECSQMQEQTGDIWSLYGTAIVAVTTNGSVTRDGRAIMGRGVARQAALRFPELSRHLGTLLASRGNHVHELPNGLVSFPVEETPWSLPDLRLIRRSAEELRRLADHRGWPLIAVPRPGCGGGGMAWQEVRPLVLEWFDGRFLVFNAAESADSAQARRTTSTRDICI